MPSIRNLMKTNQTSGRMASEAVTEFERQVVSSGQSNQDSPKPMTQLKVSHKATDLQEVLESHEEVDGPILYLALSGIKPMTKIQLLRDLLGRRVKISSQDIRIDNIPVQVLQDWFSERSVTDLLSSGWKDKLKSIGANFVRIVGMYVIYTPSVSSEDEYSELELYLLDCRRRVPAKVSSYAINSNLGGMTRLTTDFYVGIEDLSDIKFGYNLGNSPLQEGKVWGSMRIFMKAQWSQEAILCSKEPTIGQVLMPHSILQKNKHDLSNMNMMMNDQALAIARDLAVRNLIADPTKVRQDKFASSASAAGSDDNSVGAVNTANEERRKKIEEYNRSVAAASPRGRSLTASVPVAGPSNERYTSPSPPPRFSESSSSMELDLNQQGVRFSSPIIPDISPETTPGAGVSGFTALTSVLKSSGRSKRPNM